MDSLVQDVRQSVRNLRRQPGFALVAVVSLAVGIGVNSAIFSVLDALLFRPPALRNLDRAVVVYQQSPGNSDLNSSFRAFELYQQRTDISANAMAVTGARPLVLTEGPRRDQVYAEPVSSGFFAMTMIRLRYGALGAQVAQVVALVVQQGMAVCVTGAVIGLAMALLIAQLLASALSGVGGPDLLTCIAVPTMLMAIALVTCCLLARGLARLTTLRPSD